MLLKNTIAALLATGLAIALVPATPANAQETAGKTVETHSTKSRGAGADKNIKTERGPNSEKPAAAAPASKGGDKGKGATSTIHFDNNTPWILDAYVDGAYCVTVGVYGDSWCYVFPGPHALYVRATFVDGSFRFWGPISANVGQTLTWKISP
jgi:hypothetical protein